MNPILLSLILLISPQITTLRQQTLAGFENYVRAAEIRILKGETNAAKFLYFDSLPTSRKDQMAASLKVGKLAVMRLGEAGEPASADQPFSVPGGLVHDWLGIVFIPGASIEQTLAVVQDYNREQEVYGPEVIRSRLISRTGNDFKVYLRLRDKKIITVVLDTDHDVRYARLDAAHWYSRSHSTRIQEVENAGEPGERLLPIGHDSGFLWRINSYWRFEAREGGVYVECESISLTRDIPTGFGWLVGPFVSSIPEESLEQTLSQTRAAVLALEKAAP